jgi:transposase
MIGTAIANPETTKESFDKGMQDAKETVEGSSTKVDEKEVYQHTTSLYRKYEQGAFDKNDANQYKNAEESGQNLVDAEERSLKETADKYNISVEEVKKIIDKGQKENW